MKKLAPWILALATLQGSALLAQSFAGTWQGTLQPQQLPKGLRIVIKISTTDKDTLKAVMYSIDQGGQPIQATALTTDGPNVKMVISGIAGTYEGKLNADGKSMTGTWSQGPGHFPLNLERANAETAWTIPAPPQHMAANADPSFEVATIKPSKPGEVGKGFLVRGRTFSTLHTSLTDLITFAYDLHPRQVTGGPSWMESDKYDFEGKPDVDGQPSGKQLKSMMAKLLADRFKLAFHRDMKELSVYALVEGKNGAKLTKSESDPNGLPGLSFRGLGAFAAHNASMANFAQTMQSAILDRPVVDRTGVTGKYDFTLNWTPDETQFGGLNLGPGPRPPAPADIAGAPDLFTAIQEQLGLRLESTKAPVEVLVIDHVEKPSEN